MTLINACDINVYWYAYNSNDSWKKWPLKSDELRIGDRHSYSPPENATGLYAIWFTGINGPDLGLVVVGPNAKVTIVGSARDGYHLNVE